MTEESPSRPAAQQVPVLENVCAPEVFASEASFFSIGPGVLTITFTSYRFDNTTSPGAQRRVVVGRLVMPIPGAQGLSVGLYDYLKKTGYDPSPKPDNPQQVQ
jgi:hypothetical protein